LTLLLTCAAAAGRVADRLGVLRAGDLGLAAVLEVPQTVLREYF
jgi:hypothetical protein